MKFEGTFGRKDIVLVIRGSHILSGALSTILTHRKEIMKLSRSNSCQSFGHSVIFPGLVWCPELVILLENSSNFGRKDTVVIIGGGICCQELVLPFLCI